LLLALQAGLLGTFLAQDMLVFFVLWEAVLIPMVLLILVFGGAQRRRAAMTFFLYTMAGSVLLLAAVIWLGAEAARQTGAWTFDYAALQSLQLSSGQQLFVFVAVGLACAVKSPLFPFHSWLPLAYGEASTSGTALMAGVLSKMGAYGFIRFAVPLCPDVAPQLAPVMMLLAATSIVYGAVLALRQQNYKMLVAYASLSHMGYIVLGLFSLQRTGVHGAMVQVLSHGLAVAGLFLLLGLLEQRRGPAWLQIHGLATRAPRFAVVLMLFVLASLALPLTSGFTAEFLVLLGAFTTGYAHWLAGAGPAMLIAALLAATGVVLGATYMLQFARSLVFDDSTVVDPLPDLRPRELLALAPLLLLIVWIGVRPAVWMDKVDATVAQLARPPVIALMGASHGE
jgi:NADH-quinone oxidoreductase subunit M